MQHRATPPSRKSAVNINGYSQNTTKSSSARTATAIHLVTANARQISATMKTATVNPIMQISIAGTAGGKTA